MNFTILLTAICSMIAGGASVTALVIALLMKSEMGKLRSLVAEELRSSRTEGVEASTRAVSSLSRELNARQESLSRSVIELGKNVERRIYHFSLQNERQLNAVREMVEQRLGEIRTENAAELARMRAVVDERLQETLEQRLDQSFGSVGQRLEQVYRGLGEMRALANDVGDLKKVLSNVKSRGVFGEVQLGAILEDVLAPGQYEANVVTKRGSRAFVEFAVRLPGEGDRPVYLPVDAKFPMDAYTQLTDAQESGDPLAVKETQARLCQRMKAFAKDIRDKYIDPPGTTEFAILFLPFEGLYAEAIRLGLLESLQREYRVTLAGPATMAALLNSLQMGFQTLAIQQRSAEVWEVLGAVRTEFNRFGEALGATRQRLEQAGDELDRLVGVRTRMIQKKLARVAQLDTHRTEELLEDDEG